MKKLHIWLSVFLMLLSLTGCHDKALEEATLFAILVRKVVKFLPTLVK